MLSAEKLKSANSLSFLLLTKLKRVFVLTLTELYCIRVI